MSFFYNLAIYLYYFGIRVASLFNQKAKLWIKGRKNLFENLEKSINKNEKIAWFHCASLGEFEQGRAVLEKFKKDYPHYKIFLTFFSPSGYEIRKNYPFADYIFYLPIDTKHNAKKFVEIINPSLVFFIKYEFWFNLLSELKRKNISTFLVSAIFRKEQHFFKFYGSFFRKSLSSFQHIFIQDAGSKQLLEKINLNNVTIAGDTRIDRALEIPKQTNPISLVEKFKGDHQFLIAGSTWEKDEEILTEIILKSELQNLKFILAPHEVSEENISRLETIFLEKAIRFSKANDANIHNKKVLIIDNIGMLSSLYQYGEIAYIGGGFGKGIHNTLEPATFGLPIIFGPNYHKFSEAKELVKLQGAFSINNKREAEEIIKKLLNDNIFRKNASEKCKNYIKENSGATEKILNFLKTIQV